MMWKEKYKVGVPVIDEQHQELFGRVSNFLQTVKSKGDWAEKLIAVKETMSFMQEYVVSHFHDEEVYQEQINYPDIQDHKEAHRKFKQAVSDYATRMETEGYTEDLVQEFGGKLMTWLIMHVAVMDQKIGVYAKSQGDES